MEPRVERTPRPRVTGEGDMIVTNPEHPAFETILVATTNRSYADTWRYLGERGAADLAYCSRFGVAEAPEPAEAQGGALAYALPVTSSPS